MSTNISYDSFHSLSIKDDRAIAGYMSQWDGRALTEQMCAIF